MSVRRETRCLCRDTRYGFTPLFFSTADGAGLEDLTLAFPPRSRSRQCAPQQAKSEHQHQIVETCGPAFARTMRILFTFIVTALLPGIGLAGFDWGAGCEGGSGSFSADLATKNEIVNVGLIPAGKWNVKIRLASSVDVDVQVYDVTDKTTFPEGKAVIAYCAEKGCNKGKLGNNDGTAESTTHSGMRVKYSGKVRPRTASSLYHR